MVISMTGFGNAQNANEWVEVKAEVKSINAKFLDLSLRLPRNFAPEKELILRNLVKETLERGRILLSIDVLPKTEQGIQVKLNYALAKAYFEALSNLADDLQAPKHDIFRIITQMPDIVQSQAPNEEQAEQEWAMIQEAIGKALNQCQAFRQQEGNMIAQLLQEGIGYIQTYLQQISQHDAQRLINIRQRIENRMAELQQNDMFDRNRFEQEMIYYIEKLDISEEKTRLQNHLTYFEKTLTTPEMSGRKLNFIAQEMGREINTIGSKANDSQVQHWVVMMKDELEKIKEQLQNIL